MADLTRLEDALRKADAAGDAVGAKVLADEIRRVRAQTPPVEPQGGDVLDDIKAVGQRVGTQLIKGTTAFLGTPRMLADAAQAGTNYLTEQLGGKPIQYAEGRSPFHIGIPGGTVPSSATMNDAIFNKMGVPEVNGQTEAGKALDVGIQAIPGGAALGGLSGIIPAFTGGTVSETAGQVADQMNLPQWAGPAARFGGGIVGGVAGLGAQEGVKALGRGVRNTFGGGNPQETANKILLRSLERDKLTPQQLGQGLDDIGPGATIVDAGGTNVRGTARAVSGSPGTGSQYIDDVLTSRRADEPARVGEAINRHVSANRGFTSTIDDIVAQRSAKAAPLYEQAGIPKDPTQYGAAPRLVSPEVKTLIEKSKDVKAAIAQAKSLPQYADLPDDSIVLLDKAYKNIGGKAEAAKRAGDGVAYRDLNELRTQLRSAIVAERPAYGQALKTFSDDSGLKAAIEQGRKLFSSQADAEVITKTYKALAPDEQLLFRQGVAEALRDTASRSSRGSPAAKIFGGPKMQEKLKAVLGSDFDEFSATMGREGVFNKTAGDVLAGSRTAPMAAEMGDLADQIGMAKSAVRGDFFSLLARGAGRLTDRVAQGRTEKVNESLAKMLLNPDAAASKSMVQKLLEQKTREEIARILAQEKMAGSVAAPALVGAQR